MLFRSAYHKAYVLVVVDYEQHGLVGGGFPGSRRVGRFGFDFAKLALYVGGGQGRSRVGFAAGDVPHGDVDGEGRALTQLALYADRASVELDERFGQREPDAGAVGVHAVNLEEAVEDIAEVLAADTLAVVGHGEAECIAFEAAVETDAPVVGGVLEGVGEEVEEDAFDFFRVDGHGESLGEVNVDRKLYVALAGHRAERLGPFAKQGAHRLLGEVGVELPVLEFSEVKYLVNEAFEDAYVLVGQAYERALRGVEVGGLGKLAHRLGDEGQRGAQVVGNVGEEHQLRLRRGVEVLLVTAVLPVGPQYQEEHTKEQHGDRDGGVEEPGLGRMALPEVVDLGLEELDFVGFLGEGLVLSQEYVGVRDVDRRGYREMVDGVVRLPFEYGQRGAYELVPFGGVEECRVDHAVGHCADAYLRGGVDAYHLDVEAAAACHFGGGYGHAVVVGVHEVDLRVRRQEGVGHRGRVVVVPVAEGRTEEVQPLVGGRLGEAAVALVGGCGAFKAVNFNYFAAWAGKVAGVAGGHAPDGRVVDTLEGGVGVAVDVAVEHYNRGAPLEGLLYNRCDGVGLVGRGDYDVEFVVEEVADVGHLLGAAVVGRAYLDLGLGVEHHLATYFVVHLAAPVVVAALRDPYAVAGLAVAARHKRQPQRYDGYKAYCSVHGIFLRSAAAGHPPGRIVLRFVHAKLMICVRKTLSSLAKIVPCTDFATFRAFFYSVGEVLFVAL